MDKSNNLIIAIEWISGSWKTTIAHLIAEKLWFQHVWESFHFFKDWEKVPEIDINNIDESLEKNHDFLLELEKRKNRYLLSQTLLWNDIIMERTVLTLLYTEYAMEKLWNYWDYDSLMKKINSLIDKKDIILPNYIFFLKTNPHIARDRIMSRSWNTSKFFSDENTLIELYNSLFTLISDDAFIKLLKIIDTMI
jgi:thymidylate kinase